MSPGCAECAGKRSRARDCAWPGGAGTEAHAIGVDEASGGVATRRMTRDRAEASSAVASFHASIRRISLRRRGERSSGQRHIRQHMTAARPGIIMPACPRASKEVRVRVGAVMYASKADTGASCQRLPPPPTLRMPGSRLRIPHRDYGCPVETMDERRSLGAESVVSTRAYVLRVLVLTPGRRAGRRRRRGRARCTRVR
jgi:hypothetical protein